MPSALLVAVALVQIYLARVQHVLTPAKGGGFGLFSTVDKLETRSFRAYVIGPRWEHPIALEAVRSDLGRPLSLPTERTLAPIARKLLARTESPIVALRVEVWKRRFDAASGEARRVKVRDFTVRRPTADAG